MMGSYDHSGPNNVHDHGTWMGDVNASIILNPDNFGEKGSEKFVKNEASYVARGVESDISEAFDFDYSLMVDDSPENGTGNETDYIYDYDKAIGTFFWGQLAPPLAVYAVTYVVGVLGNVLIIFTTCIDHLNMTAYDYDSFDGNVFPNESLKNESEYEYPYEESLDTFFWGQLAPPLAVYAVTYVVGVLGNVLIIFTICRYRRLKTPTNVFLASLASADLLLILICIPVKLARLFSYTWTLGEVLCKMIYFLQSLSAICSVLTLTTMSIERYYAIVYPMRAEYRCTISQAKRLSATLWLLAMILASPVVLLQVHMEVGRRVPAYWCVRNFDSPFLWRSYETYMLVLVLLLPATIMTAAYAAIGNAIINMVVQRRSITGKGQMANGVLLLNGATRGRRRENEETEVRQVVSMLVVVVVLFVVCWGPILVVNVLKAYAVLPAYSATMKHVATAADLLSYCNSCVNPIVYGFMSRNFRESFWQVLCCRRRLHHPSMSRQMSLSVTRTSTLRYNTDTSRVWNSRSVNSRVMYPLCYGNNLSRGITTDGSSMIKTTPS